MPRLLFILLLIVDFTSGTAIAMPSTQPDFGVLAVHLEDAQTHKALPLARVEIFGAVNRRAFSGASGNAILPDLPPGKYEVDADAPSYTPLVRRDAAVLAGQTTALAMGLLPHPIFPAPAASPRDPLVAIVKSKTRPKPLQIGEVNESIPEAEISSSMLDALGTLPGANLQGSGNDQSVSLGGHSASATQLSIDGAPISTFGGAPALTALGANLFGSANVEQDSSNGAFGGTVDLNIRDPSLAWLGSARVAMGGLGASLLNVSESGTSGRIGVSFSYASSSTGTPLDGMRFSDTSGLNYVHDGASQLRANALKVRVPLSDTNVIVASVLSTHVDSANVCNLFTGVVPCGYGPDDYTNDSLSVVQLRDIFKAGALSGTLSLFNESGTEDNSGPYVDGVLVPLESASKTLAHGLRLEGRLDINADYPLSFHFSSFSSVSSFSGYGTPQGTWSTFSDAQVSGPLLSGRLVSSDVNIGLQSQGGNAVPNQAVDVYYHPSNDDTVGITLSSNHLGRLTGQPNSSTVSGGSSLIFNCPEHVAQGFGPFDSVPDARSSETQLSWSHTADRILTAVRFRHEVTSNETVDAVVGGNALDPSIFTPTYLADVDVSAKKWCGSSQAYTPSDLYYSIAGIAPRAVYDSLQVGTQVEISRNLVAAISFAKTAARAFGSSGPLFSRYSTLISGRQLPMTPQETANLALKAYVGRYGLHVATNLQYVGVNNYANLPAYLKIDASLFVPTQRGQLILSVLNATNQYAGTFATPSGAVPLATQEGEFPTIAEPLSPRTFRISYRFAMGEREEGQPAGAISLNSRLPFRVAGPRDPLAINRQSSLCGPEMLPAVERYDDAIRSYVRKIEGSRTADGYPATFPSADVGQFRLLYRKNGTSYAILITRANGIGYVDLHALLGPLLSCSTIHAGTLAQASELGLYVAPHDERQSLVVLVAYSPRIGLYEMPPLIQDQMVAYAPAPATSPSDPFALQAGRQCNEQSRPAAQVVLEQLRTYITILYANKSTPAAPVSFRIVAHRSRAGSWLEIAFDADLLDEVAPCMVIHGVSPALLESIGLGEGSGAAGSIDYAPRLGFYRTMR